MDPNLTYTGGGGSWATAVSPEYRLSGLMIGQTYTGTYSIPYTGGECNLPSESVSSNGLTLTYAGGALSPSGTLDYTLSGTYTGTDNDSVSFTTKTGCTIYLGPCVSCKDLLAQVPGTPDGVYTIDPDQTGTAFSSMKAQCDMTTDGGGWTLVANYAVSYAVQPIPNSVGSLPNNSFTNKLPLIGTSTLGVSELGDPVYFGSGISILNGFTQPTEWRIWGIRSNNNSTVIASTADWKAPMTLAIWNSMKAAASFTTSTVPTNLPGSTVTPTVWGSACCSAWGGRRTSTGNTGFDNYGFWIGYLQIQRTNDSGTPNNTRDNAIMRVWLR